MKYCVVTVLVLRGRHYLNEQSKSIQTNETRDTRINTYLSFKTAQNSDPSKALLFSESKNLTKSADEA